MTILAYSLITLENIVRLPALPQAGRIAHVTADYYKLGGDALGLALPLAAWGHEVAVVGNRLGEDAYGDFIISELNRYPTIDTRWLVRDERVRTPFDRILTTAGGQHYTLGYWHGHMAPILPRYEMFSGRRLFWTDGFPSEERRQAARLAKETGLTVVVADVLRPDHPLLTYADWVITSTGQLAQYVSGMTPKDYLQSLHTAHRAHYILTDGKKAVQILTAEGAWIELRPYPLAALDRVGAGEIFNAGIVHGILQELPLVETVRFANAAAALWVAQPVALKRPPTLAEISALQEERGALQPRLPDADECVCPICQRVVATALFEKHWELDARVVKRLRQQHPAWQRAQGACPNCVHDAVQQVGLSRATVPLTLRDDPIYGQGDPHALPTGVRLRANPHYSGRGVTMAFLDSGFFPHPDLSQPVNRVVRFVDATTTLISAGDDFSHPTSTSWHGMMTSVVAAGNGFLSEGYYKGLASEARVVLVKVSDPRMAINEIDILRGLTWLAEHWQEVGVKVLNLSVGGDEGLRPDAPLNQLVNQLVEAGLVVVAAAGNAGSDDLCPPASAELAITVGGVDDRNSLDPTTERIWHSNWGRISQSVLKPELIAPSIWLAAPVLPGTSTAEQNLLLENLRRANDQDLANRLPRVYQDLGLERKVLAQPIEVQRRAVLRKMRANKFITPFYQHVDGTSFAAPIIASVVAQMLEANPNLTPTRVKELLVATARPLPNVPEYRQGYGVVQPGQAVAAALRDLYGHYERGQSLSPQVEGGKVRFLFYEPRATRVSVIGEWNEWHPTALPMRQREAGVWVSELDQLPTGRYAYKFLVDESAWLDDPENLEKAVDGYGGFNGILIIGA